MSDTFTASNGRQIECDTAIGETRVVENGQNMLENFDFLNARDMNALREFFQHERDRELGRWRWPDNRDYTVRVAPEHAQHLDPGGKTVAVERESTGYVGYYSPDRVPELTDDTGDLLRAVHAYFAAHPEPKPWHDAKAEEIWVLRERNCETWLPFRWDAAEQWWFASSSNMAMHRRSEGTIVEGRRIWPEVPSE